MRLIRQTQIDANCTTIEPPRIFASTGPISLHDVLRDGDRIIETGDLWTGKRISLALSPQDRDDLVTTDRRLRDGHPNQIKSMRARIR